MEKYQKRIGQSLFWIVVTGMLCLLQACTPSLSREQCLRGNWQAIGYNDGVQGRYPSRIDAHQEACAETGVIPNFRQWEMGRKQGLVHYCTEVNARRLGEQGYSFNSVCPPHQAAKLQRVYDRAYRQYQRKKQREKDRAQLKTYREELRKLRSGDMLDFKTEAEAREYMLQLQREIILLEKSIRESYY
ncbi:DUF2799 domain-containing protein [Pasteurella skyensis]|uniref:DUF2799 domain-containing protein n=1 Tax=Phocoenobacter skyensis TaxID=97481 RepID=A0AAJ6NBW3_9PAST|nr:DUF2799 domain-containing protein [Pasteurella skyensis]MDP8162392.1 DUF2799 domain-containing protein [Pasteurella skyensis]MDP8169730.1 DUF2799 domain-containing protein [Pasteurella skyensis]MDP8172274.1 DUF2799 domain-containing protein [Pasteurella skyensis]MDP8173945.1 DUF2799 domain-containing protein [Pasteurella skyensis]MDP8177092.1 DUF2799 domain-containing protein [Pasteurella skyensis]